MAAIRRGQHDQQSDEDTISASYAVPHLSAGTFGQRMGKSHERMVALTNNKQSRPTRRQVALGKYDASLQ